MSYSFNDANTHFQAGGDYEVSDYEFANTATALPQEERGTVSAGTGKLFSYVGLIYLAFMPIPMCCIVAVGIVPAIIGWIISVFALGTAKTEKTAKIAKQGIYAALGACALFAIRWAIVVLFFM
jgi:hypothetical protein